MLSPACPANFPWDTVLGLLLCYSDTQAQLLLVMFFLCLGLSTAGQQI